MASRSTLLTLIENAAAQGDSFVPPPIPPVTATDGPTVEAAAGPSEASSVLPSVASLQIADEPVPLKVSEGEDVSQMDASVVAALEARVALLEAAVARC